MKMTQRYVIVTPNNDTLNKEIHKINTWLTYY